MDPRPPSQHSHLQGRPHTTRKIGTTTPTRTPQGREGRHHNTNTHIYPTHTSNTPCMAFFRSEQVHVHVCAIPGTGGQSWWETQRDYPRSPSPSRRVAGRVPCQRSREGSRCPQGQGQGQGQMREAGQRCMRYWSLEVQVGGAGQWGGRHGGADVATERRSRHHLSPLTTTTEGCALPSSTQPPHQEPTHFDRELPPH